MINKYVITIGTIISTSVEDTCSLQNIQSDIHSEATPPSRGQSLSSLRNDVSSVVLVKRDELDEAETFRRMSIVPVLPDISASNQGQRC